MKKKGFTLIELLAVIVILAIIALIATSIVMNVIDNSKKGAAERSAENYLRAVEIAVMEAKMDGTLEDGIYTINSDGSIQYKNTKISVDVSKNNVTSGFVTIVNGEVTNSMINANETTLMYDENGKKELGIWDGTTEEIKKSEDGYHITNEKQLAWVSEQVSSGNTFEGETLYLDADLDLNNIEWEPIGRSGLYFKGIFEGNNHTILNIKISYPQENAAENQYIGLFGYAREATIKDLTLVNADLTGHSRVGALTGIARSSIVSNITVFNADISCIQYCGAVFGMINSDDLETKYIKDINAYYNVIKGNSLTGGVIGHLIKTKSVQNIYSKESYVEGLQKTGGVIGSVENSTVSTLYSNSIVDSKKSTEELSGIGGIIGFSLNSSFDNLISEATVTGNSDIGGIIGHFQTNSTLTNSTSYARVEGINDVGGVIGICTAYESENTIENIKSYATVIGEDEVGGIIGNDTEGTTTLRNVYSKANITGESKVGGIIGGFIEGNATELQYFNLVSESTLNTEYKPYNTLFGYVDAKTTLTQLNS